MHIFQRYHPFQAAMREFGVVCPESLPAEPPPLRDIQHQIEKLRRQVGEMGSDSKVNLLYPGGDDADSLAITKVVAESGAR